VQENRRDGVLVLFDVDKTLFMNSDPLMGRATTDAIEIVWGRRLAHDAIKYVDHPGQTATRITRLLLRADGVPDDEIDPGMGRWCKEASARYLELLVEADTSDWHSSEGAEEAIAQIEHRALLTGNPEPVARARMERIGLNHLFPQGQGAFGCDAEDRPTLIQLARERAGDWPREDTVAVGDTVADITGARAAGVRVIGFAPEGQRDELAGADIVIETMAQLPSALARLSAVT
jgi:phosphoglycolate phosphatase-like HAD superfamily hydrolase